MEDGPLDPRLLAAARAAILAMDGLSLMEAARLVAREMREVVRTLDGDQPPG